MNKEQLEFGLGKSRVVRNRRGKASSQYWFQKMRAVVDSAFDWSQPANLVRPEQICFSTEPER